MSASSSVQPSAPAPAISVSLDTPPSLQAIATQRVLRQAVSEALERKRRLGHYAVIWEDGHAVDVPPEALPGHTGATETPSP
jgi:hypothetical protein